MSGGLSFGALPSFADLSPDMQAQVMAALQGQDPQQPKGLGGLLGQMDPQGGPPVAMSEADTRRMERAMASPADAAALDRPPSLHDLLFSGSPTGGVPNSFQPVRGPGQVGAPGDPGVGPIDQRVPGFSGAGAGASQSDPQATGSVGADGSRLVPLPPQRPSDLSAVPLGMNPGGASGAASGMPSAPAPQGATNPPAATGPASAPNVGQFDPLTGQVVSGSPQRLGTPPAAVSPTGAAQATGQAGGTSGGSLLERFANRLNNPAVGNLLLNVGMGLMSQRGFGPGITAGLQGYQSSQLNQTKQALQQFQLMQQIQGQNATRALLKTKGYTPEQIEAGVYNPTLLTNMLAQENRAPNTVEHDGSRYLVPPGAANDPSQWQRIGSVNGPQPGFEADPNNPGGQRPITGGSADPAYKGSVAGAEAKAKSDAVPDKPIQVRPGGVVLDPNTYKPLYTAPGNKPEGFETEDKLRTEFSKQLGTFAQVHDGYGRVIAATKQRQDSPGTPSPASDIGLIFGYMKMLDPGSVVREGEYATAKNATGVPERVLNAYNKALNGEFLTDAQRKDFLGQAAELYGTSRKTAEGVADRYRGLATQYGVSPERSVYLPDAPTPPRIGQQSQTPQQGDAASRYQQLRQGGLSQADAYAKMHQEGF